MGPEETAELAKSGTSRAAALDKLLWDRFSLRRFHHFKIAWTLAPVIMRFPATHGHVSNFRLGINRARFHFYVDVFRTLKNCLAAVGKGFGPRLFRERGLPPRELANLNSVSIGIKHCWVSNKSAA